MWNRRRIYPEVSWEERLRRFGLRRRYFPTYTFLQTLYTSIYSTLVEQVMSCSPPLWQSCVRKTEDIKPKIAQPSVIRPGGVACLLTANEDVLSGFCAATSLLMRLTLLFGMSEHRLMKPLWKWVNCANASTLFLSARLFRPLQWLGERSGCLVNR